MIPAAAPRNRRERILWITNVAAPYRVPVWRNLATHVDLKLAFLESDRQLEREGRRGEDWRSGATVGLNTTVVPTIKLRRGETSVYFAKLVPLLGRKKPTAVLLGGWESPAYWQFLALAKLRRIRCVGFYESTLHTNRFRAGPIAKARSWFMRRLDAVVVPGIAAREAVESFGVSPARIKTGFNAVDVTSIADRAERSRQQLPAVAGHRFIFVGQLIERKRPDLAVDAFARSRSAGDTLTIVGDGHLRASLEEQVNRLDLDEFVTFTGPTSNADAIGHMLHSETLVMPSEEEVWGLVVNEALAAGLQTVVSDRSGVAPSVQAMRGVFVRSPDTESLAQAMQTARESWTGPIQAPEILRHTTARFSAVFLEALLSDRR